MRRLISGICFAFVFGGLNAETTSRQPTATEQVQIAIWPGTPPDSMAVVAAGPETVEMAKNLIAGKSGRFVTNVTRPTITVYPPKIKNTGAAVVVFPGGGYVDLAIDLEGTEVCDWLTAKGITCVRLKYRVPVSGPA